MPTIRDNYAYIHSNEIEKITALPDTWAVSEGQPMEPPPKVIAKGEQFLILFQSGRHKTGEVADKFSNDSGGRSHLFSPFSIMDEEPSQLNFCFGLRVHWKSGETSEVYLGQGSTMGRNNWWIGSTSITNKNGSAILQAGGDVFRITGYDSKKDSISSIEDIGAQAIPPALVWIIKEVGQKVAEGVIKLITANVNSFRISK
ncbi:hypothetical protein A6D6_00006 [Alcanivorax xiamenensis]|uniref:Uncharacterized protein n=1 Tax=Alcanivorax xiamenensis TaxID=1177156 RepID=A0ABQ6YDM1_9GAMM|nr:hypothetical protein [Alcanivorax xiamenensis]KAF0808297.1 hypothetical protein A6D6_00006 [Alcanivorax xiamenensis]